MASARSGRGRILIKDDSGDQCGTRIEVEYSDEGAKALAEVGTQVDFLSHSASKLQTTTNITCVDKGSHPIHREDKRKGRPLAKVSKKLQLREESGSFGIGTICVLNISPRPILFKMKTTEPTKFHVVPPIGSIAPKGEARIEIEIRKKKRCEVREDSFLVKVIELPYELGHPEGSFSPPHCPKSSPNYYDFSYLNKYFERQIKERSSFVESHEVECCMEKRKKDVSISTEIPIFSNSAIQCQLPEIVESNRKAENFRFQEFHRTKPKYGDHELIRRFRQNSVRQRQEEIFEPTISESRHSTTKLPVMERNEFPEDNSPFVGTKCEHCEENEVMVGRNRVIFMFNKVSSSARRVTVLQLILCLCFIGFCVMTLNLFSSL